jgi:hypothetical protein
MASSISVDNKVFVPHAFVKATAIQNSSIPKCIQLPRLSKKNDWTMAHSIVFCMINNARTQPKNAAAEAQQHPVEVEPSVLSRTPR